VLRRKYIREGEAMNILTMSDAVEIDAILHSELFDARWYAESYPDVAILEMMPEYHFYFYGGLLGRPASENFGPDSHEAFYRTARSVERNPLTLFLEAAQAG
jgi:hypothetical protein